MSYEEWNKMLISHKITKSQIKLIQEKIQELKKILDFFEGIIPDPDYIPSCGYYVDEDNDEETELFYINLFREEYEFDIVED